MTARGDGRGVAGMGAWRFVVVFGVVSLLVDMVYEGARSITGPLLAELGASALLVGVVTGIGEAAALLFRLASGPLADRSRRFWSWAIAGYAMTVISVPLLGFSGVVAVASILVIIERVGKAVRSPAKDAMLSFATSVTGRGRGFALQEALDQVGAITGPLLVGGMLLLTGGAYGPSLAVLVVPGIAALVLLGWLRIRVPAPEAYESSPARPGEPDPSDPPQSRRLPLRFWLYASFTATTTVGFATFGLLSFHLVEARILPAAAVPLLYAGVMVVDGLAALATGWLYDRIGARVLLALPVAAALVAPLAFGDALIAVIGGALLWGAALGIQESTLRATVAELVPAARRGTAYGVYAAVLGVGTALGGALTGLLYTVSVPALVVVTAAVQAVALVLFLVARLGRVRPAHSVG